MNAGKVLNPSQDQLKRTALLDLDVALLLYMQFYNHLLHPNCVAQVLPLIILNLYLCFVCKVADTCLNIGNVS
jgi:hypothetical protein